MNTPATFYARNVEDSEYFDIAHWRSPLERLPFALQTIMRLDNQQVYGYEMLFRGSRPCIWSEVDCSVLSHLAGNKANLPLLFVNLSNDILLNYSEELFIAAAHGNNVIFEVSEKYSSFTEFRQVIKKINALIDYGLRFAIDDFGSGQDGMQRLYALNSCTSVKIDGQIMRVALQRSDAADVLKSVVSTWKSHNIITIAEGIETKALLDFATRIGFDLAQGWHIDELKSVTTKYLHA